MMGLFASALKKAEEEGQVFAEVAGDARVRHDEGEAMSGLDLPEEVVADFSRLEEQIEYTTASDQCKVLPLAGATSGDGATTITYLLGMFYVLGKTHGPSAREPGTRRYGAVPGRKVLIVDANVRNACLHKLFDLNRAPGLTEIVEDGMPLDECLKQPVQAPLAVITAGRTAHSIADLLKSEAMKGFLQAARERFTHVFIDMAPVIQHPDVLSLGPVSDGVILVARADKTRMEVLKQAKTMLERAETKILGVVLNRREYYIPEAIYRRT